MRAALDMRVAEHNFGNAAQVASNLTELQLDLGDVADAIGAGEHAVRLADTSLNDFRPVVARGTLANALAVAGRRAEAEARFLDAERMQAGRRSYPILSSVGSFYYCDMLLADSERAAWRRLFAETERPSPGVPGARRPASDHAFDGAERLIEACEGVSRRATQTLGWADKDELSDLTIGLDRLTLARAALYAEILRGGAAEDAQTNEAVDRLRRAGSLDHLPRGLLTLSLWRGASGDFAGAAESLDEAFEIAERGPMRLFLADIHLHRARLFGLIANPPATYPWVSARDDLDTARKLIETCGYGRRREELEDAEAAWERISGTTAPAGSPAA